MPLGRVAGPCLARHPADPDAGAGQHRAVDLHRAGAHRPGGAAGPRDAGARQGHAGTASCERRHILRVAAPPIVTGLILGLAGALGGAILIETVFNWRGMGRLYYDAISGHARRRADRGADLHVHARVRRGAADPGGALRDPRPACADGRRSVGKRRERGKQRSMRPRASCGSCCTRAPGASGSCWP